jgi:hypothetical protein
MRFIDNRNKSEFPGKPLITLGYSSMIVDALRYKCWVQAGYNVVAQGQEKTN